MTRLPVLLCGVFLVVVSSCYRHFPSFAGKIVDLTHEFSSETVYWLTSDPFEFKTVFEGYTPKGYYYSAYKFCAAEHGGTHMDAPVHFAEGKDTVDRVPLSRLVGGAVVVDVSGKALSNPDYEVSVSDFADWERMNGRIGEGSIVLIRTGFGMFWHDRKRYMGTDERGEGAVAHLHFPGLSPTAAAWLVGERRIAAVGIDTPSIDYGQSKLFESHRVLFKANTPAFENVANLERLPPRGATVIALPMKIKGGSGGPLRIIAVLP